MNYSATSLFAWRGRDHLTVVELPEDKRGLEHIQNTHTIWAKKHKGKGKKTTRSTDDMPLWYIIYPPLCSVLLSKHFHTQANLE